MNIQGLDFEKIVSNIVDVKHSDMLNNIQDEKEKEEKIKELVDYYSNGDAGKTLQREIGNVSDGVQIITDIISSLNQSISSITAPATTPQVLVVGQATGTPNPAWGKAFSASIKPILLSSYYVAEYLYDKVNDSCESISFSPPSAITALKVKLDSLKTSILSL